jgi:hypothetical protein
MSKEYLNRWDKPLVNPPVTLEEYEKLRSEFSQEEVDELVKVSQEAYLKSSRFESKTKK